VSKEFEECVRYCENKNLYLVMGCDSNAHFIVRSSTNCNDRWEALVEFFNSSNLEFLIRAISPPFAVVIGKMCLILPWVPLDFQKA